MSRSDSPTGVAEQELRGGARLVGHLAALEVVQRVDRFGTEDRIATDGIVDRHDHLQGEPPGVRHDHLVVGERTHVQLTPLQGSRQQRVVTEGHQMYGRAVFPIVAVGGRHVQRTIADPVDDAHVQVPGRTCLGHDHGTGEHKQCKNGFAGSCHWRGSECACYPGRRHTGTTGTPIATITRSAGHRWDPAATRAAPGRTRRTPRCRSLPRRRARSNPS